MIEERISTLIQSIDCLTAVINQMWSQKDEIRGVPAPEISAEPPKETKPEKAKSKKVETDTPEVKDLEGLCLDIIRDKGPKLKKQIRNTISAHGGKMIADCPIENLPTLKTALEAIAA